MNILIIAFLVVLFFQTESENDSRSIYIAKISWHVGLIIDLNNDSIETIDGLSSFKNFNYADIGWGDEDFYKSDSDFDFYLAAKAVFLPSSSVLRMQGYNNSLEEIIKRRDYFIEIRLSNRQFKKLCMFINKSFAKDDNNIIILSEERYGGIIKFYNSVQKYHLGYTCNTWIADALKNAEFDIDPDDVITAEELFFETAKFGKILKMEE